MTMSLPTILISTVYHQPGSGDEIAQFTAGSSGRICPLLGMGRRSIRYQTASDLFIWQAFSNKPMARVLFGHLPTPFDNGGTALSALHGRVRPAFERFSGRC